MARVTFTILIRAERVDEYDEKHAAVPQPVLDAIKAAGVRNYSIHRHENRVFGYFECDDPEATLAAMDEGQRAAGWDKAMAGIVDPAGGAKGAVYMREVFRLD